MYNPPPVPGSPQARATQAEPNPVWLGPSPPFCGIKNYGIQNLARGGNRSRACAKYNNAKFTIWQARKTHGAPLPNIELRQLKS